MADPSEPNRPFDAAFEPYAREIGFLIRAWNDLQEKLADLFGTILDDQTGISRAIWYAIPNDRFQREALRAAAKHKLEDNPESYAATVLNEIIWLINKSNSLGRQRDQAAHAPVALLIQEPLEFIARYFHGNPLAQSLRGKKLLDEFRLYRQRAIVLHDYTNEIESWLRFRAGRATWPNRPVWPNRAPSQTGRSPTATQQESQPQRQSPPGEGRPRRKR